jgi:transcriptional regulator with XRE-family HTH domain
MGCEPADRWSALGEFIREQRSSARLSLRRLSELAGISNPYLSQIERGLRRPSADILQQIAKALRISAETLYVQAGILDPPEDSPDLARQILANAHLTEEQKQALIRIYLAFRHESESGAGPLVDLGTIGNGTIGARVDAPGHGSPQDGSPGNRTPGNGTPRNGTPRNGTRPDVTPGHGVEQTADSLSGIADRPTVAAALGDRIDAADGGPTPPPR